MVDILLDVAFPKSNDSVAALFHIGILRLVQLGASLLSMIKSSIFGRITMPIVAIKLNDSIKRWDEGINTKLFSHQMLGNVLKIGFIKQRITEFFKFIWSRFLLLIKVHLYQAGFEIGIIISTSYRTVLNFPVIIMGCRFSKFFPANFANMISFVSSLPKVCTSHITEMVLEIFRPSFPYIYFFPALVASRYNSLPPICTEAFTGAKALMRITHSWLEFFAAMLASIHRQSGPNTFALATAKFSVWSPLFSIEFFPAYSAIFESSSLGIRSRQSRFVMTFAGTKISTFFISSRPYIYLFLAICAISFHTIIISPLFFIA